MPTSIISSLSSFFDRMEFHVVTPFEQICSSIRKVSEKHQKIEMAWHKFDTSDNQKDVFKHLTCYAF